MEKYYFGLMEDSRYVKDNWFSLYKKEELTEDEIKELKIVCDGIDYELVPLSNMKEYMKKHSNYRFYESLLKEVDEESKKYLLENIPITKHSEFAKSLATEINN